MRSIVAVVLLVGAVMAAEAWASQLLPAGGIGIALRGATAAGEPDLAGKVLHDDVLDFVIRNVAGVPIFQGKLQHRVVRSDRTGYLHFYYRVRDTVSGLPGRVARVAIVDFTGINPLRVDYRVDGLGTVASSVASRSTTGRVVTFAMTRPGITAGAESRFFFIKTQATTFRPGGMVEIRLLTGEFSQAPTTIPVP